MTKAAPPSNSDHIALSLNVLTELGADLRARPEPEHLYTAASIGAFGAVAWGIAALDPAKYGGIPWWRQPAIVAVFGVSVVAAAVTLKIGREHKKFDAIKKERARIASLIPGAESIIPANWKEPAGRGYLWSIFPIWGSAALAIGFSLAVFCST
jgi:hypothetical protein